MGLRITAAVFAFSLALLGGDARAQTWERWFGGLLGQANPRTGASLEAVARHIASSKAESGSVDLAVELTDVGHWRIVNRAGEAFTAAGDAELAQGLRTLAPDARAGTAKLHLSLTPDTALRQGASLRALPADAELSLVMDGRRYPLVRAAGASERPYVVVGRDFLVEVREREALAEIVRQIERPVDRSLVRILALEPGGATALARSPTVEPGSRRARPDLLDPGHLDRGLGGAAGQVVLVSGRLDGDRLVFKASSGPDGSLAIEKFAQSASRADVNLVILETSSSRQPGTRNWLWQRMALANVDKALGRASLGAFLHALGGESGKLVIKGGTMANGRIDIALRPLIPAGPAPVTSLTQVVAGTWADIVSETAGSIATLGLRASLLTVARQREIDRRIIPGIPFMVQAGYLGLLIVGLLALPVVNQWWQRLWPREVEADYAGRGGFAMARLARGIVFSTVFLPLAGLPALFVRLATVIARLGGRWRAQGRHVAT